jgi:hypothetical protein
MANEYKPKKSPAKTGRAKTMRELGSMLDMGGWLNYDRFVSRLPFLFFLCALAVVYIWNKHTVESQVRELNATERELTELRWHYDSSKDELARASRQSSVASRVAEQNIFELTEPPHIILTEKEKGRTIFRGSLFELKNSGNKSEVRSNDQGDNQRDVQTDNQD